MKAAICALALLGLVVSASAKDRWELDGRIHSLAAKFSALEQQPDRAVPRDILRQATGIVLLSGTKAGFVFAYEGGSGVAMLKDANGNWGPVAFVKADHASVGFQAGSEDNFSVIVLIGQRADDWLLQPSLQVGGEARGVIGDTAAGAVKTIDFPDARVLFYGDSRGLFGGADVGGGALAPDNNANRTYYNRYDLSMRDVLFDHAVQTTEAARDLANTLNSLAQPTATMSPAPPPPAPGQ